MKYLKKMMILLFTFPIKIYQLIISPWLPAACIYTPTCSFYTLEAIQKHGILKGFMLGITRIFRCIGLFYQGGIDPVPLYFSFKAIKSGYRKHKKVRF